MDLYASTTNFLDNTQRAYRRIDGGFSVAATIDGLPAALELTIGADNTLTVNAALPVEALPKYTEEVLGAVNTANAFANFGGFALSPADNVVRFRSYVRLRGDVENELRYLLESAEKALDKFAPLLIAVCRGRLSAAEYSNKWNKKLKE